MAEAKGISKSLDQERVIQEASRLLYRDVKQKIDDFSFIDSLYLKAVNKDRDNHTLINQLKNQNTGTQECLRPF